MKQDYRYQWYSISETTGPQATAHRRSHTECWQDKEPLFTPLTRTTQHLPQYRMTQIRITTGTGTSTGGSRALSGSLPGFFASQEMNFMYTYTKNHQRGRKAVSVELESGIPSMQGICADPGQGSQPSAHPRQHAPCSQGLSLCPRISARCHFGSNQSDISLGISFRIESERHLLGQFLAKLFPSHLKVLELRPRGEVSGPRVVLRNRIEKVLRLRF